jgi:uncharacterized membrane protein YjgN (DUF898 family)
VDYCRAIVTLVVINKTATIIHRKQYTMNSRTEDNNFAKKQTAKIAGVMLLAASLALLPTMLAISLIGLTTANAQSATNTGNSSNNGMAPNKYLEYVNHVHGGYRFLERHTWHYNSTKIRDRQS